MGEQTMELMNPNAGGLDVGAEEVYASVPKDRDEQSVRRFGTYTPDIESLADWLVKCRVDTVALESTGVYWIPIYEILMRRGIRVEVVNARHLKHVPGRKSDVQDCQWIQQLHSFGLLRGSFRPTDDLVVLRTYLRHRESLIEDRATHVHRMQKELTLMNVRLTEIVSDITGMTGMDIVRAIVAGERDPHKLATFRQKGCKHSEADFIKAMTGHYREEELFALKQELELYDSYTQHIRACDEQVERQFSVMKPTHDPEDVPPLGPSRKKGRSKNEPGYDARTALYRVTGVDLTDIDGLNESTVQTILSEIGTDMSKWPTEKHFCAWLGLAPKNDISGGKVLRSRTMKVKNRAAQALRLAAQSVSKTQTALGAFFRRKKAHLGVAQAIVATAHKLARIIYLMLKDHEAYRAMSAEEYDKSQRDRALKSLNRQARRLGYVVVPQT